ncbi:MAG: hypothetical protein Q7S40_24835 [Opitutaceae bacterium]|nr:hypothetical protein [Opitutaceae bacterium]
MIRRLILSALATAMVLTTGCNMFRKSKKPKESSAISSEIEENFRRRWVEKRAGELAGQGVAADAARSQAESEFRERYNFSRGARP